MTDRASDSFLAGVRRAGEWMVLAVVVFAALAAVGVPRLAGAHPYVVLTGSMRPVMPPGTLVVVRPVAESAIQPGDVITFMPKANDPSVVTHRVVGLGFDGDGKVIFQTKGDANDAVDPWVVRPAQVVGKRWYFVPYLGWVTNLLTGQQRALAVQVLAALLVGYALVMFAGAFRDRVRRPSEVDHAG